MNTTLQQDICDVLGTISPNEKTVKKYEGLTQSDEDAQTFLSLLKSPFIFKAIVCDISPEGHFAKKAFRLLQNGMVTDEWMEFKEAYLSQISDFTANHHSIISEYITFEMELAENFIEAYPNGEDILDEAKAQRFELEEKVTKYLGETLENYEMLDKYQLEIRAFLETIVILNCTILEDPFFEHLFERNVQILRALLKEE